MKKFILSPVVIILSITGQGQFFKQSEYSAYVLYGRHFTTDYVVDSGVNNLVGRKMNISWEAGFSLDYKFNKNWGVRTGAACHIQFIAEIFYGTKMFPDSTGSFPTGRFENIYIKGVDTDFRERVSIGIPIKVFYSFKISKKYEVNIAGGPYLNIYMPTRNENIAMLAPLYYDSTYSIYVYTRKYEIRREFNKKRIFSSPNNSKPFIEWQFDAEIVRKFKRYGALTAGIKTHTGTKKLERAEFTIWPEYPAYRSKGHYVINRSYIGVYAGFRFGKNPSYNKVNTPQKTQTGERQEMFTIYAEGGGASPALSLNMDKRFISKNNGFGFRAGIGLIPVYQKISDQPEVWEEPGPWKMTVPIGVNYLLGEPRGKHFLEIGLQATYVPKATITDWWSRLLNDEIGIKSRLLPSAVAGYRFTSKKGGPIFRVGYNPMLLDGGYRHWISASLGWKFTKRKPGDIKAG